MGNDWLKTILFVVVLFTPVAGQKKDTKTSGASSLFGIVSILVEPLVDVKNRISVGEKEPIFRVLLLKGQTQYEAIFRANGNYEASVPEGIYQIFLKKMDLNSTPYRRANFQVLRGKTSYLRIPITEIDESCDKDLGLVLVPTIDSSGHLKHSLRKKGSLKKIPIYTYLRMLPDFRVVIKSCRSDTYRSTMNFYFARLTYKDILIEADKIIIDLKKKVVRAFGGPSQSVFFSQGKDSQRMSSLTFGLQN